MNIHLKNENTCLDSVDLSRQVNHLQQNLTDLMKKVDFLTAFYTEMKRLDIIGTYTIGEGYAKQIAEVRQIAVSATQIGKTAQTTAEGAVAAVHGNAMTDEQRNNYTVNALAAEDKAIALIKEKAEKAEQDAATAKNLAEKGITDAAAATQAANLAANKAALVDQKVDKEIADNNDYHERNNGEWKTLQQTALTPLRELGFLAGE